MAHYDEEKARATMMEALHMWDEHPDEHPFVVYLLGEGPGSIRADVPRLVRVCGKVLFFHH